MSRIFYVGNLNHKTTTTHLREHFSKFGDVARVCSIEGIGSAIVLMVKEKDGLKAIRESNNTIIDDYKIMVSALSWRLFPNKP